MDVEIVPAKRVRKYVTSLKVGRPTMYTEETRKTILDALCVGIPYEYACYLAGITYTTGKDWISKRRGFSLQVEGAKAIAIRGLVTRCVDKEPWRILKNLAPKYFKDDITIETKALAPLALTSPDGKKYTSPF